MKYVILIHSNPQPWGHPTADFLPAFQALPDDVRARLTKDFEEVLAERQLTASLPEQRYLNRRLARLTGPE